MYVLTANGIRLAQRERETRASIVVEYSDVLVRTSANLQPSLILDYIIAIILFAFEKSESFVSSMLRLLSQQTVSECKNPLCCIQMMARLALHGHSLLLLAVGEVSLPHLPDDISKLLVLLKLTTRVMLFRYRARILHSRTQGL